MATLHRSALVMHSAKTMYDLVNDVAAYPQFLPNCADAKVEEQSERYMTGAIKIAKGGMSKWFTTRNHLCAANKIEMSLVDGPFKKLSGVWHFEALDEHACKVSLDLDFEFSNQLVALAFGKVFSHVANNMVKAFVDRANSLQAS
ncbi:ubiquinone-binding protein [Saccharobesus litoralis]|uniref:Ubiquinone-binding protein n=1 Tax=Saccharobesus litoralis TaxID=2172099 RepID=A0A2S0VSQ0_9ALTE|nr:type II toxin-antitoxin system RatA family toxin [Saccharobesus litoralis]AWB67241.1 ubiquinone-binding protein [Saccharobesus litoralis]